MIQRYDLECHGYQGSDLYERDDGDYCRWSDVEPLLPRWVPTSERLPVDSKRTYSVLMPSGACVSARYETWDELWLLEGHTLTPTHWLEFQLPALPPLPSEAT